MNQQDLLLKLKDFLLTSVAIFVGLILAWYWTIENIAWAKPYLDRWCLPRVGPAKRPRIPRVGH